MPHSITHGDACFAYFNKIWGIPWCCSHRSQPVEPFPLDELKRKLADGSPIH